MASGNKPPASLAERLARLGLRRPIDFVLHLPLRYEDETRLVPLSALRPGAFAQVQGRVRDVVVQLRPRRQLVVHLSDDEAEVALRFLNFYPTQTAAFQRAAREGTWVRARGEVRGYLGRWEMVHPRFKVLDTPTPLPTALTPVYPTTEGVSQPVLRRRIQQAMGQVVLDDILPADLIAQGHLMALADAVTMLHSPPAGAEAALLDQSHPAWQRIKFDELLAQQLSLRRARERRRSRQAPVMRAGAVTAGLLARLPFALTAAQQRVMGDLAADLAQPMPMTRLLQGDVGAGKTIIAAFAAAVAIDAGYQVAFMAPTELLAEQHVRKLLPLLSPVLPGGEAAVAWLSGSLRTAAKRQALAALEAGAARLAIGTHALIQDSAVFDRLGLVIVDEQHRFGVAQRLALRARVEAGAAEPHQLMMSATPIPRTLAMTYFADLDVSVLDELPPGRTPVVTKLIDARRRDEIIGRVHAAVRAGQQAYWVCPLIEENEDAELALKAAVETHAQLAAALVDLRVGLVHGRLPAADKQQVMEAFARGEVDVLVATTVIEVGVDVPRASLMVIEHAERFGLAQLHQLRGRVGRGETASVCVLLYAQPLSAAAKERLRILHASTDGFEIARQDLALRGPGEFLGARQSGAPLLRFANLDLDGELVDMARRAADRLWTQAPAIAEAHLQRWLGSREDFLQA